MVSDKKAIEEVRRLHRTRRDGITTRLSEFRELWENDSEAEVFAELVFCLLTPQSKARLCWEKVEELMVTDVYLKGSVDEISSIITPVRFKHTKAQRIVEAVERFGPSGRTPIKGVIRDFTSPFDAREWLAENVNGLGYKEASHFLRNIGRGDELAILDRHILRNLSEMGVIEDVPKSLSRKMYLEIERRMGEFADSIGVPLAHLDIVLWCKETGEIFK